MKRLIIINIILLLIIHYVPLQENIESTKEQVQEQIALVKPTVSSRGLEESRNQEAMEPKIIIATEISQNCIDLVKKSEGFSDKAYILPGESDYTIGYGHSDANVYEGQTITEEAAERLLKADLKGYEEYILKYCEYLELNQNQLDALVSFTYNGGPGMLHQLTANKTRTAEEIAEHITSYTKSSSESNRKGLLKRRTAEKELFLKEI